MADNEILSNTDVSETGITSKEKKKSTSKKAGNKKTNAKEADKKIFRNRVWEIQSHTHDDEGNPIFTEEEVRKILDMDKSIIRRYCWILHDKDEYTEIEEYNEVAKKNPNPTIKAGNQKPAHIHLILEYKNSIYRSALQKRVKSEIGLSENFVRFPSTPVRYNQFMACATYLTHIDERQQVLGKHVYPYEYVNYGCCDGMTFDYTLEVKHYLEMMQHVRAGRFSKQTITEMVNDIERGITNPEDIRKRFGYGFYLDNETKFKKARLEYIKRTFNMPSRVTVYVEGKAGTGKSTVAQMIAENLYKTEKLSSSEAYFVVGQNNVKFDNYDYQPILLWDDVRGDDLLSTFSHEEILNLFDLHPRKRTYNIKFGSIILTNSVNLCTGIDDYLTFMELLSGAVRKKDGSGLDYEKMEEVVQIFRRIPLIVRVVKSDIELWEFDKSLLSAYGDGRKTSKNSTITYSPETGPYRKIKHISMGCDIAVMKSYYADSTFNIISAKITKPIIDVINKYNQPELKIKADEFLPVISVSTTDTFSDLENQYSEAYKKYISRCERQENNNTILTYDEWYHAGRPSYPGESSNDRIERILTYGSLELDFDEETEYIESEEDDELPNSESEKLWFDDDYPVLYSMLQNYVEHSDADNILEKFIISMQQTVSKNPKATQAIFALSEFEQAAKLAREKRIITDSSNLKSIIINNRKIDTADKYGKE